jgi:hypothetical protein
MATDRDRTGEVLRLFFNHPEPMPVDLLWAASVDSFGKLNVRALLGQELDDWEIDFEFDRRHGLS